MENKSGEKVQYPVWIGDCAIVYATEPPGYEPSSRMLQAAMEEMTGIKPPVCAVGEDFEASFEILIGCTDRPLSKICYAQTEERRLMTFELLSDSQSLQIA